MPVAQKYPDEPEFLFRRALVLWLQLGRTDEARDVLSQAEAVHPGWSELALRFADAEMIPVRRTIDLGALAKYIPKPRSGAGG